MGKFTKQHLLKLLNTSAGETALKEAAKIASNEIISAAKYYIGTPDGKYFDKEHFESEVVEAGEAHQTINTILGGRTAEMDRFFEGKKQVPGLITSLGVRKIIHLVVLLYCLASGESKTITYETVKACRQSELLDENNMIRTLTSTTKLPVEEIMALGYGDKNHLAICRYHFKPGATFLDMEVLGEHYLKPEEREVLILPGSRFAITGVERTNCYVGRDGMPAKIFYVDVYPTVFEEIAEKQEDLEEIVFDENNLKQIRNYFIALNEETLLPIQPECYENWKNSVQKLMFLELKKFEEK